jgi:hypothetical protein
MNSRLQRGSAHSKDRGGSRGRGYGSRGRNQPSRGHRSNGYDRPNNYGDRSNAYKSNGDRSSNYAGRSNGYGPERGRSDRRNEHAAVRYQPSTNVDHTRYDRQQPTMMPQQPDLQNVLKEISNALVSLVGRVDSLEKNKGSDNKPAAATRPKTAIPAEPLLQKSNNDDFVSVSKALYKIVQIGHHTANWERLPSSIEERLTRLVGDINPPMSDTDFRRDITVLAQQFGEEIRRLVADHLHKKRVETEGMAGSLDPTDLNRAKDVASKYLTSRLGRRLTEARRTELMNSAASTIGVYRRPPPPVVRSPPVALQPLKARSTVKQRTSPPRNTGPHVNGTSRKRLNVSTNSTPIENRFTVLQHEVTSDIDVEPDDSLTQLLSPRTTQPTPKKQRPPRRNETTTQHGVHVFTGNKDEWRITADSQDTCVIVVGDSNLRNVSLIPQYWQVNCLPGADLCHLSDGLAELVGDPKQYTIVLQAGMNHRDKHDADDEQDIKSVLFAARRNPAIAEIYFNGVSIPSTLSTADTNRLNKLNRFMETEMGSEYFIDPLQQTDVTVDPNDRWRIHYDQATVDRISVAMIQQINGTNF